VTKFIRVHDEMGPEDLYDTVTYGMTLDEGPIEVKKRPNYRIVGIDQGYIEDTGPRKLDYYLDAPLGLINLIERDDLLPLEEFVEISRGPVTGANKFFILDEDEAERRGIDDRFLSPVVKSIRGMRSEVFREGESDKFILDVHDYVEEVDDEVPEFGTTPEEAVKSALKRDGYESLHQYITEGEDDEINERDTCESRNIWFDLGDQNEPDLFHPKFFNERVFTVWNQADALTTNAVDCVYVDDDVDSKVVVGVLNSSLYRGLLECWGRAEGGGALQLMTYEVESIPVPNVREFSEGDRDRIRNAVDELLNGDSNARERLNEAVLEAAGIESIAPDELEEMRKTMTYQRIGRAEEAEVLLQEIDATAEWSADYFTTNDGNTTLDEYVDG